MSDSFRFRAGDTVTHVPTGETWVLAVDQHGDYVSWSGWPEGMAPAIECEIVERASDTQRHGHLLLWATMDLVDHRVAIAKTALGEGKTVPKNIGEKQYELSERFSR